MALVWTACIDTRTKACSWGRVCPAEQVCDDVHQLCVYPAQLDQCVTRADGHPCVFPGAEPDSFMCQGGVCLPKAVCGNGIVEQNEACDATALGVDSDLTCPDLELGFTGGVLLCDATCELDVARCTTCDDGLCEPDETSESCPRDCGVVNVSAGEDHSCMALNDGTARCWGAAEDGQLGNLDGDDENAAQAVYGVTTAVGVSAGGLISCMLLVDGQVRCCGDNTDGALGDGLSEHYDCGGYDCGPAPVSVAGLQTATQIAAGAWHACALLADTTLRCWGDNEGGQLGDNTIEDRFTPTPVLGLSGVVHMDTGSSHTCAALDDGSAYCWGWNDEGSLGDDSGAEQHSPVRVLQVEDAVEVGAGQVHSCVLLADGRVRCWGNNYFGQLGDGTETHSTVATWVVGLQDAVAITSGTYHNCALRQGGTVVCWGANGSGRLGNGSEEPSSSPVQVTGLTDVVQVDAGGSHTCALSSNGALWCWGANAWGQLGNGTWTDSEVPTRVQSWNGSRMFE